MNTYDSWNVAVPSLRFHATMEVNPRETGLSIPENNFVREVR